MKSVPGGGSHSRGRSMASVVLPAPVGPTIATELPATIRRLTSRSAGGAVGPVSEREMAQLDLAAFERHGRRGFGPVGNLRTGVEDLDHPVQGGEAPPDDRQHPAERHRRPREVGDVPRERHQDAEGQSPVQHGSASDPEDAERADAGHDREERREEPVGPRLSEDARQVLSIQPPRTPRSPAARGCTRARRACRSGSPAPCRRGARAAPGPRPPRCARGRCIGAPPPPGAGTAPARRA